ncbi:hypothetical protein KEM54_005298 [Ascosphaera aggregata]|nr:hypothetical protein KEM54_005298 [Ascosphaera aggregata]
MSAAAPPISQPSTQDRGHNADRSSSSLSRPLPSLPNIRMLDPAALTRLLSANTSPPEITSILLFDSNGAIFAHSSPSPLTTRQLRSLAATYGAAFTTYATVSTQGNLTGVSAGAHPSSYITAVSEALLHSRPRSGGQWRSEGTSTAATSVYDGVENTRSLGRQTQGDEVGNTGVAVHGSAIAFDDGGNIAVVTRVTGTILLAVIGPCTVSLPTSTSSPTPPPPPTSATPLTHARRGSAIAWPFSSPSETQREQSAAVESKDGLQDEVTGLLDRSMAPARSSIFRRTPSGRTESYNGEERTPERHRQPLGSQEHEEGRKEQKDKTRKRGEHAGEDTEDQDDLCRLASLNLSASPEILLALESKSAALGKFLGARLRGLVCPDDF